MSVKPMLLILAVLGLPARAGAQEELVNWETPHVSPLAMTSDGARLLAVNTPDNRLEVFDLTGGAPLALDSIPVGLDPVSVRARTNGEVWVVNHVSDSVSVVDLDTGCVVATLATDDEPCDVVFAGTPTRAFVSCSQANAVLVFDPADLAQAPVRIPIRGEDPRALAVSPSGDRVYVALFESGNRTTALGGGRLAAAGYPPQVVNDLDGPHGGVNPPPNAGASFDPPITPGLPVPSKVAMIVRRDSAGRWLDDTGADWSAKVSGAQAADSGRPVGWTLLDHDVALLNTTTLAVTYAGGLMNLVMAIAVHPTGAVSVVGTEATNEVRYEPKLRGNFVRTRLAAFLPSSPGAALVVDLNTHLTSNPTVPQAERDKSVGDPRAILWNSAGTRAYVTGMGSNNVVVLDALGHRAGLAPTIEVGQGPTGLVLDEPRARLYVLNKFEASLSVVSTTAETELARIRFFDPSPPAIRKGRRHLYDTHATSGNGVVSCASCHVDARLDRLAWDLGDPAGEMKANDDSQNQGAGLPALGADFQDWHPMKGPMLTQTLQDIIGKEPHHWRGDRDGIEEFNGAFASLLGDDALLTPTEMQEFEDFLATIHFPPNPFRNLDNSLPTDLPLPGHYTTGRFGPPGLPLPNGNALTGLAVFRPPNLVDVGVACITCHTRSTGFGTDSTLVGSTFEPFPVGPLGEHHLALTSSQITSVTLKVPGLRNLYERTGFNATQLESTAGFGYIHDGTVDSIERFVNEPVFAMVSDQQTADLVAFLLAFSGDSQGFGSPTALLEPPGTASQATHAAVGKQLTLDGPPDAAEGALLDAMLSLANAGVVGLVVKGRSAGLARGWVAVGGDAFQSDRKGETHTRAALEALAGPGTQLTFTVVPKVSERRIGVDRDSDGWYDRDELDAGSDPADPEVRPKHRFVPPPRRP